jgi:hypothetical protein
MRVPVPRTASLSNLKSLPCPPCVPTRMLQPQPRRLPPGTTRLTGRRRTKSAIHPMSSPGRSQPNRARRPQLARLGGIGTACVVLLTFMVVLFIKDSKSLFSPSPCACAGEGTVSDLIISNEGASRLHHRRLARAERLSHTYTEPRRRLRSTPIYIYI